MNTTYTLILVLLLFMELVLLLIHYQSHAEKTRMAKHFYEQENEKLERKIEGLTRTNQELQRDLDDQEFELSHLRKD